MINTFIAYDDNDYDLGDYFDESHNDIFNTIAANAFITNISICGLDCTAANIAVKLAPFNAGNFIFIVLSHGNENEFVSNEIFISATNAHLFANSLLYSTACSTGRNLGNVLVGASCKCFIGYDAEINVLLDYANVFFTCENFGIKSFLLNDESIETSYNKMIGYYDQEIGRLYNGSLDDLIAASYLVANRDSLIHLGSKTITRNDFH